MKLMFGNTPVPVTASWTSEEGFHVARCDYFGQLAICQAVSPGEGKPLFGKPHAQRQRRAIALGLCDLCGRALRTSTKVSLSHARPQPHGAAGWAILQVEPMLHKECAATSIRFCPSLRRDLAADTIFIRQVTSHRAQCAKVELLKWIDRDLAWLGVAP